MRTASIIFLSLSLSLSLGFSGIAEANQPTPGCNYRYWGGNQVIKGVEGFKVVAKAPEYHTKQTFGIVPARKTIIRKPAYDGGPMLTIEKELTPASNTITQRVLLNAGYFVIKNKDDAFVGRFDKPADVQNYVCSVLIPSFGQGK